MFANKAQDSEHHGFPGSVDELEGLRVRDNNHKSDISLLTYFLQRTIIDCEGNALARQDWDLGESLMKGKTNQLHVKTITNMFLVHEDLQNILRNYRWMESSIKKYVQFVLHNRLKYLKQADKDAKRSGFDRARIISRKNACNRKNKVSYY
ncbi:hypothetical protein EDC96DRAFT_535358 [Choanephora cucurbitarum]|nr:hypothetical protein EDC96DRAFT_535358 [Choanephora cucurbitarum]